MLKENLSFIGVCALVFAALLGLAYLFERTVCHDLQRRSRSRNISYVAMFSALGGVLMLLEIPLFFAPGFYKMDLSELPVLMSAFYLGPVAGVITELLKVLSSFCSRAPSTAFVGDFATSSSAARLSFPPPSFTITTRPAAPPSSAWPSVRCA